MMKWTMRPLSALMIALPLLSSCSYNPFISNNRLTGSPASAAVGTAAGAGIVALFRGSTTALLFGGLVGGSIGYYVTTLRYDSGGIIEGGGQVYKVGDFVGINIPSDNLFYPNTADFTPTAIPILDSAATVLQRYPNNNILVSGNTSNFGRPHRDQQLSLKRAEKVASYLWNAGINQYDDDGSRSRQFNYVGYGDYFPIANDLSNTSIRENSRIQITSYPWSCRERPCGATVHHIATPRHRRCGPKDEC